MMGRYFIALCVSFALQLSAGTLPYCSDPRFDQDGRVIIVEDAASPSAWVVLQILSTMQHQRFLFDSLFPIIKENRMTIHTRFFRYYEREVHVRIDEALKDIVSYEGVTVRCTLYQPGET